MVDIFRTRRVGRTEERGAISEIFDLAVARGRVSSKIIPAKEVVILKPLYVPGHPIMYRVAYPLNKEHIWEIADVSDKELTPFCSPLPVTIGDF